MERLRILAAAAALREFTPPELVAFSGAKENTVRSVLTRDNQLFRELPEREQTETPEGGPGRPPKRYRVMDVATVRELIREQEQAIASLRSSPATAPGPSEVSELEDPLAAITVAEDAILRAWEATEPEIRGVLAETARNTLAAVQPTVEDVLQRASAQVERLGSELAGGETAEATPESVARRVHAVTTLASVTERLAEKHILDSVQLKQVADAVAELVGLAGRERAQTFFEHLVDLTVEIDQLPPVAVITDEATSPPELIKGLEHSRWFATRRAGAHTMWWQDWARSLVSQGLVAGLLVTFDEGDTTEDLEASLNEVAELRLPKIVLSSSVSQDVVNQVGTAGAVLLSSALGVSDVAGTLDKLVDQRAGLFSSGPSWELASLIHEELGETR